MRYDDPDIGFNEPEENDDRPAFIPRRREDVFVSEIPAGKYAGEGEAAQQTAEEGATDLANEKPDGEKRPGLPALLHSMLSGNILSKSGVRRAYPYMIFVAFLAFLYIANAFRTQYLYREHLKLAEQVKELRSKSLTIASQKMQATRQSNIMVKLKERNIPLRESLTPNKVIPKRNDGRE